MTSKTIHIISSYTVSKLRRFFWDTVYVCLLLPWHCCCRFCQTSCQTPKQERPRVALNLKDIFARKKSHQSCTSWRTCCKSLEQNCHSLFLCHRETWTCIDLVVIGTPPATDCQTVTFGHRKSVTGIGDHPVRLAVGVQSVHQNWCGARHTFKELQCDVCWV